MGGWRGGRKVRTLWWITPQLLLPSARLEDHGVVVLVVGMSDDFFNLRLESLNTRVTLPLEFKPTSPNFVSEEVTTLSSRHGSPELCDCFTPSTGREIKNA